MKEVVFESTPAYLSEFRYQNGGVPQGIFDQVMGDTSDINKVTRIVPGLSGETMLSYTLASDRVSITDAKNSSFHFLANVNDEGELLLRINRKGYQGEPHKKHPDIYPQGLLEETIRYFDRIGMYVGAIKGRWKNHDNVGVEELTDNYDKYREYLDALPHLPTDEDKIDAALSTWTGKQAQRLGFTRKVIVRNAPYGVEVTFLRGE